MLRLGDSVLEGVVGVLLVSEWDTCEGLDRSVGTTPATVEGVLAGVGSGICLGHDALVEDRVAGPELLAGQVEDLVGLDQSTVEMREGPRLEVAESEAQRH